MKKSRTKEYDCYYCLSILLTSIKTIIIMITVIVIITITMNVSYDSRVQGLGLRVLHLGG